MKELHRFCRYEVKCMITCSLGTPLAMQLRKGRGRLLAVVFIFELN